MNDRPVSSRADFNKARFPPEPPLDRRHDLPELKPTDAEPNRDAFDRHWQAPTVSREEFIAQRTPPDLGQEFRKAVDPPVPPHHGNSRER